MKLKYPSPRQRDVNNPLTITFYSPNMMRPYSIFPLAVLLGFAASTAYAATEIPTAKTKEPESNQVVVALPPDEPLPPAPVVEMALPKEKAKLLGAASADTPAAPVLLSKDAKTAPAAPEVSMPPALRDALAYVYEHHPQLLAEREGVKVADEGVSQAISGFRPDIFADYSKGRARTGNTNSRPRNYGDTESKGLTIDQPIFSGLDTVAAVKAAKQRMKAARADLTALEQQVFYNVVIAYTGVAEAQSVLLLNQNNVDVLTKQRDATKIRFDVGELTQTDVSQADARLANAKANEQQALGDLSIARADFVRAVGYPAPETVETIGVPPNLPERLDQAAEMARAASPILEAAKHREKAFQHDIAVQTGSVLPDVSLQASMRRSEGGNAFITRNASDALTLNVVVPLYQGGGEWSRIRAARNTAKLAQFNTMDTYLAVEQDVTSAWQNYVTAGSVIASTEAAVKASSLALEGVRQESDYGVRTVLDVLDAEQEFMNTKVNFVRATRAHKIQAYRLLASIGKLTASELMLPVKIYDPQDNYNDVKYQLLGW